MIEDSERESYIKDLIRDSALGDMDAYRSLVNKFSPYAYKLAFRTLLNDDDAEDIVQEAFIRVWKHLHSYKPEIKFTTWLYKIVINLCMDKLKHDKRKKAVMENYGGVEGELKQTSFTNPEHEYSNKELAEIIEKISDVLPPKQRIVFVLRDLQGIPAEEVSTILNMSVGSIKTNLFYARKHMAQKLSHIEIVE